MRKIPNQRRVREKGRRRMGRNLRIRTSMIRRATSIRRKIRSKHLRTNKPPKTSKLTRRNLKPRNLRKRSE